MKKHIYDEKNGFLQEPGCAFAGSGATGCDAAG